MSLIGKVGRKQPRVVLGIAAIYTLLILGGTTMVYPYLITLTSAMTNDLDYERYSPYPRYWFDAGERYLKFVAEKYADLARFEFFRSAYKGPSHWGTFRDVAFEPDAIDKWFPVYEKAQNTEKAARLKKIAGDYHEFLETHYDSRRQSENMVPLFLNFNLPVFRQFLQNRYTELYRQRAVANPRLTHPDELSDSELEQAALVLMAQVRGDAYDSFISIDFRSVKNYAYELQKWMPAQTTRHVDFLDWIRSLPVERKMPLTRHYLWTKFLFDKGWDAKRYSRASGLELPSLAAAPYPAGDDLPTTIAQLREEFDGERWPIRMTRIVDPDREDFLKFARERYPSLSAYNQIANTDYDTWDDIPFGATHPYPHENTPAHEVNTASIDAVGALWRDYVATLDLGRRIQLSPEGAYQAFLLGRYGSLDAINEVYGWEHASLEAIHLPQTIADYQEFADNTGYYIRKFITFNFGEVLKYMATRGRALFNTIILVLLTIGATLTVNPLAAYALSRFQLKATPKILIFLLATMAFPPEVAMIPSFLLLRDLGLLNTFAALVLPGLANGFSIFLLKGFFDSLPKELYEAASIDGASELRMFTTITLPLCKPILAVIALHAFIAAYGGFMWAFLVCQDQKMWTLMVWLYQFQQLQLEYPYLTMAALVLASIPTLIVFLSCQKIILRGIIIPTMK